MAVRAFGGPGGRVVARREARKSHADGGGGRRGGDSDVDRSLPLGGEGDGLVLAV